MRLLRDRTQRAAVVVIKIFSQLNPHYEVELGSYVLLASDQVQRAIELFTDHVGGSEAQADASLINIMSKIQVAKK